MELFVDIKKKLHGYMTGNGASPVDQSGFTLHVKFEAGTDALGLLGASGSGKSMTLRCIAGLEKPDEGRIVLNNRVLFDSENGINIPCRKRKVGFLFQNYALFPNMTVEENIGFALESLDKKQRNEIVQQKIKMVKLEGMERRHPYQLSGGQQQRVALARALAIDPEVLLLDEPLSALDDHLRSHMINQLKDTLSDYHGVALFVTHNMEEAYRICNKLVVLVNGRVEAQEQKEKLFEAPPTLATAQLTGCKNFSAAGIVSQDELDAIDWDIKLKTGKSLVKGLKHVGIRANYIRLATETDHDNVFKCWPCATSETPFRMTVFLSLEKEQPAADGYHLQWEISKEEWIELKGHPLPWRVCLSPEKLMTFNK